MTVRHCVLLTLQQETNAEEIERIVKGIQSLKNSIPNIRRIRVGKQEQIVDDGRNASVAAVVDLVDEAAYAEYAKHPQHLKVIKDYILPRLVKGGRRACQFILRSDEDEDSMVKNDSKLLHIVLLQLKEGSGRESVDKMVSSITTLGSQAKPLVAGIQAGTQIVSIDDGRNSHVGVTVEFKNSSESVVKDLKNLKRLK